MRKYNKWTDEEISILSEWIESGKTIRECSEKFGRPYQSVWNKADRLGLVTSKMPNSQERARNGGKICAETCPYYCPFEECKLATRRIKDEVSEYIDRTNRGITCGKKSAKVMLDGTVRRMLGV